jgi:hypothetical protein
MALFEQGLRRPARYGDLFFQDKSEESMGAQRSDNVVYPYFNNIMKNNRNKNATHMQIGMSRRDIV